MITRKYVSRLFSHIPTLSTERLTLRRMLPSDAYDMYEYASLPEVTRYLTWRPHESRDFTRKYLEFIQEKYRSGEFSDWAVVVRDGWRERMIGTCGFTRFDFDNNSAEVGYVLNPAFHGQGIATEALSRVLSFGFHEMELNRIEARYMLGNKASRRVMDKVGMHFEGVRRSSMLVFGEYRDIGVCSIIREEYI